LPAIDFVDISMPAVSPSCIFVHIGKRNVVIEAREIIELFESIYGIVESIHPQKPIIPRPVVLGPHCCTGLRVFTWLWRRVSRRILTCVVCRLFDTHFAEITVETFETLVTLTGDMGMVVGTCVGRTQLAPCLSSLVVVCAVGAVLAACRAGVGPCFAACALARPVDVDGGEALRHVALAGVGGVLAWRERDASVIEEKRTRLAACRGGRVAVSVQRTGLAGAAAVGGLEGAGLAGGAGAAVGPAEARLAEAVDEARALGEGEGGIGTGVARLRVLVVVGRRLLVRPPRAGLALMLKVVEEAGVAEAGVRRDGGLRRARVGVAELAGRLPWAGLKAVWSTRDARWRGEVQLCLRIPCDALAADSTLGRVGGAERREHEAGRARRRAKLRSKRVAYAKPARFVCRGVFEMACVAHGAQAL